MAKSSKNTALKWGAEKVIVMRPAGEPPRLKKPKRLINPPAVRQKALARLVALRPALAERMRRVSAGFLDAVEGDVLNALDARIKSCPSVGKTLKP